MQKSMKSLLLPFLFLGVFSVSSLQYPQSESIANEVLTEAPKQCSFPSAELKAAQTENEEIIFFVNCGGFF